MHLSFASDVVFCACVFVDAERRSVSTMNLSKHTDPVISKRLSSSSATLLNSQDRGKHGHHLFKTIFTQSHSQTSLFLDE